MNDQTEAYLKPVDDGLSVHERPNHTRYKLKALELFATITNNAMHRNSKWGARVFIDLQAGPGKNKIGQEILLGSPLLALTLPHHATHFFFNDSKQSSIKDLQTRVEASPCKDRVRFYTGDLNKKVDEICEEIQPLSPALKLAFLDPEGLEVEWPTVKKLADLQNTDLIINFSTSGISRSYGAGYFDDIDRFFGTTEWRPIYERNRTQPRRSMPRHAPPAGPPPRPSPARAEFLTHTPSREVSSGHP